MAGFRSGETAWIANLGNLRNAIRQELVARQLAIHVLGSSSVLDVGCGQGTQALRLLEAGHAVTGVEPSHELIERFEANARAMGLEPELLVGQIETLEEVVGNRQFSLVCAHGLLMYLEERADAVAQLAARVKPGGLLSFTVKNADALAFRPALRRDWSAAVKAFGNSGYVNEIGVAAEADFFVDVERYVEQAGFEIEEWYGVRVFNDGVSSEMAVPADEDFEQLLEAELLAGSRDPYRSMASQTHVIARRPR